MCGDGRRDTVELDQHDPLGKARFLSSCDIAKSTLANAGVAAVVQPGGSVKDEVVTAAADEAGIAMVTTGERHFRH